MKQVIHLFMIGICVLVSACKTAKTPNITDKSNRSITTSVQILEVDKFNQIYAVNHKSALIKFDSQGKKIFEYANRRQGNISIVDVTDPLNVLIYHQEQGIIKLLDNTLTEVTELDLYKESKYADIETVCLSNDGNFWIFDPVSQRLLKLGLNLEKIVESNPLRDLITMAGAPKKMREAGNTLLVLMNDQFLLFDNFGQFIKSIPAAAGVIDFQYDAKNIIYNTKTSFRTQKINFEGFAFLPLPPSIKSYELIAGRKLDNNTWIAAYQDGIDIVKPE